MAWLHAKPKSVTKARHEVYEGHPLPDLFDDEYLHEYFDEVGYAASSGCGLVGISWQELIAWNQIMGGLCNSWDLLAIHTMSANYAGQFNQSDDQDREPPYKVEKLEESKNTDRFKSFLDRHIKK